MGSIMLINSKRYWSAIACKLVETFISVKLWVLVLASFFAWKLLGIFIEIKDFVFLNSGIEALSSILDWSKKILDIALAMFVSVIVTVLLSREVFKHAKISMKSDDTDSEKSIKEEIT